MTSQHVLALLGYGPTGRFTHDAWTIEPGTGLDGLPAVMASSHEAHHAALNASTAWGAMIQAIALAGRDSAEPDRFRATLIGLVDASRRTHEAFATHASVMDVIRADRDACPASLLAGYPGYQTYLDTAAALGPDLDIDNAWRQAAAESALQACMQSPALVTFLEEGLDRFTLSSVRQHHHPDRRLAVLARTTPAWWKDAASIASGALGDRWDALSALSCRDPTAHRAELGSNWVELRRLCIDSALRALHREGFPSLSVAQTRKLLPAVTDKLARAARAGSPALKLDTDASTGAFGLFEMETVRLGDPRPACLSRLSTTAVSELLSGTGTDRHLYVVARHPGQLQRRFTIRSGAHLLAGTSPVVAVQTRRLGEEIVDLRIMETPEALPDLSAAVQDGRGLAASVSLACTQDQEWLQHWAQPLQRHTTATMLLDLPITQCLDAFLDSGERLRYTLAVTSAGDGPLVTFACRLGDDPPVLLPCTMTAGQAFIQYLHGKSQGQLQPDITAIGTSGQADVSRLVIAHLVEDERITGAPGT